MGLQTFRTVTALLVWCAIPFAHAAEAKLGKKESRLIAAIQAGEDISKLGILHRYYEPEGPSIATLRGCQYSVLPQSRREQLHIDWSCSEQANNATTRIYMSDGKLSRFEFQPSVGKMAPTSVGLALTSVPSAKDIAQKFNDAVVAGADPTLGGLIPISPSNLRVLRALKGCTPFGEQIEVGYGPNANWSCQGSNAAMGADTTVHLDGSGRPKGLWIRLSPIRSTTVLVPASSMN